MQNVVKIISSAARTALLVALGYICFAAISAVSAMGEITEQMLLDAQADIDRACPLRWQQVRDKIVVPANSSEDIWQDASDRAQFVDYVTDQIAESGITACECTRR